MLSRHCLNWLLAGFASLTLAVTATCSNQRHDTSPIAFEVRHTGPNGKQQGFFVSRTGFVRRFDFDAEIAPQVRESPNGHAPVTYTDRILETSTQLDEPTINELLALIPAAAGGALACRTTGTEVGQTSYAAWTVDSHGAYSRIWLSRTGKVHCSNTAAEAQVLLAWLKKYASAETISDRFSARGNVCASDELVVQSPDGIKYCSERLGPAGDNSCERNGNSACAGGRRHCRELDTGVLTCVQ